MLLITPKTTLAEANALLGIDPLYTATQVTTWQAARKVAIEPVFDLLSKLLLITGTHKPLLREMWRMFHLFRTWHPAVATRNVNECPMQVNDAKYYPHQNRFSIKITDL